MSELEYHFCPEISQKGSKRSSEGTAERMRWAILHLIIFTLTCQSSAENEKEDKASCPEQQRAFRGSCFAFVGVQRTFSSAQEWCEESGGHLAFIPDKSTQYFLEKHLDSEKDTWLGMASPFPLNQQNSINVEGKMQNKWKTDCFIVTEKYNDIGWLFLVSGKQQKKEENNSAHLCIYYSSLDGFLFCLKNVQLCSECVGQCYVL